MKKRFVAMLLVLSMCLALSVNIYAAEAENRAPDGTLILEEYPEMQGTAEKDIVAEAYMNYKYGNVPLSTVSQALKEYYLAVGEVHAAVNAEQNFADEYMNSRAVAGELATSQTYGYAPGMTHHAQETNYYCGPATAQSILDTYDITISQSVLAGDNYLMTDSQNGTPWYYTASRPYVMADTLNSLTGVTAFTAKSSPTVSELKTRVITAVDTFGRGVAANFYITANASTRPSGYPNTGVYHWVPIRGYLQDGDRIAWFEPVHGAESVSWSDEITTPYYFDSATNVAAYVAQRGIIW